MTLVLLIYAINQPKHDIGDDIKVMMLPNEAYNKIKMYLLQVHGYNVRQKGPVMQTKRIDEMLEKVLNAG